MKKMAPKKTPMKMTSAMASRVRMAAKKMLGRDYVKPDKDSAAGAAT
jgi:hypothetical protein